MSYVLEAKNEAERLEKQSQSSAYDYKSELQDFNLPAQSEVLDAGCGSGIVTRYLAEKFKDSQITGCDFSPERISFAINSAETIPNASFDVQDLAETTYPNSRFNAIVCRYVLQHLQSTTLVKTLTEFKRILKPSGKVTLIDTDGLLVNLHPQTDLMLEVHSKLLSLNIVDCFVGRKLPKLLADVGFTDIHWRIESVQFDQNTILEEAEIIRQRFNAARSTLVMVLKSESKADAYISDYLNTLYQVNTTLFFNKFIIEAKAPASKLRAI